MPITLARRSSAPFDTPPPEKYKGPPPRAMAKSKSASNVPARMATVNAGTAALPIVNALLSQLPGQTPNWQTSLNPKNERVFAAISKPSSFQDRGGSQAGQESIAFDGSKILEGEEVYVLKDCPPAQSIGKTVLDKGYLFVWDPRENVPYLIAPENINRCKFKVPCNARICASRVVEYVPQYDEQLSPRNFIPADRLTPVCTALPADPVLDDASGYSPSFAGEDVARLAEVAEADPPGEEAAPSSPHADVPEGAAQPSAPSHPLDDKMLVELGDGIPIKDEVLKKEATSQEHLLTHYPKNPYCPLFHILGQG